MPSYLAVLKLLLPMLKLQIHLETDILISLVLQIEDHSMSLHLFRPNLLICLWNILSFLKSFLFLISFFLMLTPRFSKTFKKVILLMNSYFPLSIKHLLLQILKASFINGEHKAPHSRNCYMNCT